jgi:hypothetical protein
VRELSDPNCDLKGVLMRGQFACHLMGWFDWRDWCQREINGYKPEDALSGHRGIVGELTGDENAPGPSTPRMMKCAALSKDPTRSWRRRANPSFGTFDSAISHAAGVVVLRDVARVVARGGALVITFSNRCFPTKAVAIWQALDDAGHAQLIERYLTEAGIWRDVRALDRSPHPGQTDPLFAVVAYAQ